MRKPKSSKRLAELNRARCIRYREQRLRDQQPSIEPNNEARGSNSTNWSSVPTTHPLQGTYQAPPPNTIYTQPNIVHQDQYNIQNQLQDQNTRYWQSNIYNPYMRQPGPQQLGYQRPPMFQYRQGPLNTYPQRYIQPSYYYRPSTAPRYIQEPPNPNFNMSPQANMRPSVRRKILHQPPISESADYITQPQISSGSFATGSSNHNITIPKKPMPVKTPVREGPKKNDDKLKLQIHGEKTHPSQTQYGQAQHLLPCEQMLRPESGKGKDIRNKKTTRQMDLPGASTRSNQVKTDTTTRESSHTLVRANIQQNALANYFTNQHKKMSQKSKVVYAKIKTQKSLDKKGTGQVVDSDLEKVLKNIKEDIANRPLISMEDLADPMRGNKRKNQHDDQNTANKLARKSPGTLDSNPNAVQPTTPKKRNIINQKAPLTPQRKMSQKSYIRKKRLEIKYRDMERAARYRHRPGMNMPRPGPMARLINRFRESVKGGPTFVCMPCNRMLYRHTVRQIAPILSLNNDAARICTTKIGNQTSSNWICHCCRSHIIKGKVPPMAIANGLAFPPKPVKMDLHQLEWRLLAPRIVFMKIHQAPRGKQYKVIGNVVNVVANIANTVNSLPRTQGNAATIPVKLKRRLKFKHHTVSQNIRPNAVRNAAKWLVKNGPLYRDAGIKYNDICFRFNPEDSSTKESTTNLAAEGVFKTNKLQKDPKPRFRCHLDVEQTETTDTDISPPEKCFTSTRTYDDAIAHIQSSHNSHDRDSDRGHTHNSTPVNISEQKNTSPIKIYHYYCPLCLEEYKGPEHPQQHMFTEHGLLDLDDALSYHNCVGGEFTLETYKAFGPESVAIITNVNGKEISDDTWVIEKRTLKISQSYIEKRQPKGRPSRKWNKDFLPENMAFERIFNTVIQPSVEEPQQTGRQQKRTDSDQESDYEYEATGTNDTMLTEQDYLEPPEFQAIYNFAPAEDSTPKSIFLDKHCEELAYPDLFLGHARPLNNYVTVQYSDIVKSELLQVDRRAALNVENLFFKTKKLQMKLLTSRTNLALRQHKTADMSITAGSLKNPDNIRKIIQHDQGYQFLATLRGSPPYFKRAKQDLFAMLRQLGPATFFISLSAAETKWTHLLKILGQTVDKVEYSDEDIHNMRWETCCRLVQSDPITCARHFDYQLHILMAKFFKSQQAPIGKILDYFYRIEMQHRGSCHVHMVVWIEGAPVLETTNITEVIQFIDKYITCRAPVSEGTTEDELVSRQKHHHTPTCKKHENSVCRFNYPQPPFPETVILDPLSAEDNELEEYREKWTKIHAKLEEISNGTTSTFEEFLTEIELSFEEYKKSVQASLRARTIFLRRTPQEVTINNYNRNTLFAWQANMDIQYVLDAYACATYIVAYISKGSRGMSKLLAQASAEVRAGNSTVSESMRHIGNQFVNSVEISAQEAAYLALQMSLRKSSRTTIFINTGPPHERVRLLKKKADLESMDDEDTNIDSTNLIKRYGIRPKNLEKICLAEWASWYDNIGPKKPSGRPEEDVDGTPIQDLAPLYEENEEDYPIESANTVQKGQKRRKKGRIIRCPWYDVKVKEDHHYRELLMLFIPWREESVDILGGYSSHKEHYQARKEEIMIRLEEYSPGRTAVEEALQRQALDQIERQEAAAVAPSAQHADEADRAEEQPDSDPDFRPQYDIGPDMGIHVMPGVAMTEFQHNRLTETQLWENIRQLNTEQRTFFDYISHVVRTNQKQIFAFLSGGAGCGKSHLSKAIYQYLIKIYDTAAGEDADSISVLVMAPTGKSAHIIKGMTIHSALKTPFNNVGPNYIPLTVSTLNTLRSEMSNLKFVIIDEISMCGNNLFNYVDRRLQDIMGLRVPFGGVHMLCIGDLFQLQPVCDTWVFQLPSEGIRALANNNWTENYKLYELQTIMRQRDHKPFAELLNRLREGKQTDSDTDFITNKCIKERYTDPDYPHRTITHLYCTNKAVEKHNDAARRNEPIQILADDHLNGTSNEEMTRIHLAKMKDKPTKDTQGLPTVLVIAIQDRVEMSQNVAVKDGLTNGAAGEVKALPKIPDNTNNTLAAGLIWVLFDDHEVGRETRAHKKKLYTPGIRPTWTPVETQMKRIQVSRNSQITVTRTQFPLRIAAAKTVHRSQGQTLNAVVTDFSGSFGHHMHYVALSRVSDPEQLYVTYFNKMKIATDNRVHAEMRRLRKSAQINIPRHIDYRQMGRNTVACFINIRSMNRHAEDLASDYNYKNSFFTAVAETHLMPTTKLETLYETHHYMNHNRTGFSDTVPAAKHGISCFATSPFEQVTQRNTPTMECTVAKVTYPDNYTFICVYRYHRTTMKDFLEDLNRTIDEYMASKLVIVGDMNLNTKVQSVAHRLKREVLDPNNLQQLPTGATTIHGSTIDHVYTNLRDAMAIVVPTYYSDHDLLKIHTM